MSPKKPPPAAHESQHQFLERLERSYEMMLHGHSAGSAEDTARKLGELRQLIGVLKARLPHAEPDHQEFIAPPETLTLSWQEFQAFFAFYEEAIDVIQQARHSVRFARPLQKEPKYPRDRATVLGIIRRVLVGLRQR